MKITKFSEMVKKCLNYFFWPKTRKYPHAMFMKKNIFQKKNIKNFLKLQKKIKNPKEKNLNFLKK